MKPKVCCEPTWLPNQHWIVLGPSTEDLYAAPDLVISSNHWIKLPFTCCCCEIPGILAESLVLAFWILIYNLVAATNLQVAGTNQC